MTSASEADRRIACRTKFLVDKAQWTPLALPRGQHKEAPSQQTVQYESRKVSCRHTLGRQTRDEETTLMLPVRRSVYAMGHCHPRGM